MRRLLLVVPLVAVFAVVGFTLFRSTTGRVGQPAPAFELPDLADPGRRVELNDLRGRPAVLNFWASWCEPCRDEAPELARTARALASRVQFLGVAILDGRDAALEYTRKYRVPYPSVRDARGSVSKDFGVTGVPETVFVDARGTIVGHYIGAFKDGQLGAIMEEFLRLRPGETLEITGRGETRPVP